MTIALSCNLTDTFTEVLVVDEVDKDKLKRQLDNFYMQVTNEKRHPYSLFVVGDSLIEITKHGLQKELVRIADDCTSFVNESLK
jgi:hypothetical protein